jgi:hypothetical protein
LTTIGLPPLVAGVPQLAVAYHSACSMQHGQKVDAEPRRLLAAAGVKRIVLVTHATHMRRAVHEFTDAGVEVVPAPVGMHSVRNYGISRYMPEPEAMQRAYAAIYELLGEPVRALLAATHLRRH